MQISLSKGKGKGKSKVERLRWLRRQFSWYRSQYSQADAVAWLRNQAGLNVFNKCV